MLETKKRPPSTSSEAIQDPQHLQDPQPPQGSVNDSFPDDEEFVDDIGRCMQSWSSNSRLEGIFITHVEESQLPFNRKRVLRICLMYFPQRVQKKGTEDLTLSHIDEAKKLKTNYKLQFVDQSYQHTRNPSKDFESSYGPAIYFEEHHGFYCLHEQGYKTPLTKMVEATDDHEIADMLMEHYSDNELMRFGTLYMQNIKMIKRVIQPMDSVKREQEAANKDQGESVEKEQRLYIRLKKQLEEDSAKKFKQLEEDSAKKIKMLQERHETRLQDLHNLYLIY